MKNRSNTEQCDKQYVIDDHYDFDTFADGPRPSDCGSTEIHLQFEHDEVMEMGKYFLDEDPTEVDYDDNFGIKDKLDAILADSIAAELEKEWKEEHEPDPDEEQPDFYDWAYERMGDMYHCWDEQFKQDCIDYYLAHQIIQP